MYKEIIWIWVIRLAVVTWGMLCIHFYDKKFNRKLAKERTLNDKVTKFFLDLVAVYATYRLVTNAILWIWPGREDAGIRGMFLSWDIILLSLEGHARFMYYKTQNVR